MDLRVSLCSLARTEKRCRGCKTASQVTSRFQLQVAFDITLVTFRSGSMYSHNRSRYKVHVFNFVPFHPKCWLVETLQFRQRRWLSETLACRAAWFELYESIQFLTRQLLHPRQYPLCCASGRSEDQVAYKLDLSVTRRARYSLLGVHI